MTVEDMWKHMVDQIFREPMIEQGEPKEAWLDRTRNKQPFKSGRYEKDTRAYKGLTSFRKGRLRSIQKPIMCDRCRTMKVSYFTTEDKSYCRSCFYSKDD